MRFFSSRHGNLSCGGKDVEVCWEAMETRHRRCRDVGVCTVSLRTHDREATIEDPPAAATSVPGVHIVSVA